MNALVSVVIPVYNGAEYLEATVNTILAQDYDNVEILLINDGSKDNSEQLINTLVENHSSIKAFHKQNDGVAAARNYGIERASGDLVAFCDQDDFWLPTKLSKQVPLFENPKVGLVYCGAIADYAHLNKQDKPSFERKYRGDVFDKLIQVNMFTCCTAIARKNLLQETQAFDDERSLMGVDDWLAWLKLSLVCELDFVAEHLAIHVFHGDNYSSNEEKMHAAELVCLDKIQPMAEKYNKSVDWNEIKQNLHVRYANTYIYNGMFNLAGDTLLKASKLKNNSKLSVKGRLFKIVPNFIWRFMQKTKRAV
jgi:glycosyltransferase involved in cell wall biosynthesis